jgi:hypothetical protein
MSTSNTLNGLSLTAIAAETLPVLQKKLAPFSLYSTDFTSDVATAGSAVSTRIPDAVTAAAYSRATGYTDLGATSSVVTVTLNQHIHYTVGFDDSEIGNVGLAKLQGTFITPAVNAVVNHMQSASFALVNSTNYPAVAYSASYANFGFTGLIAGNKVLDKSGSMAPRGAVLNPETYYDLLDDVKANYVIGDNTAIRAGEVGEIAGTKVVMSVGAALPGTGLAGFVCGKDAIAIAARVPSLAGSTNGVETVNVTDPDSGFTVQLRQWYSADEGMWKISAIGIYGVSKANGSSLARIITTD